MSNILQANFNGTNVVMTEPLYQYDYGQILQISGLELPVVYEVHFSNDPNGVAKVSAGNEGGVEIPDEYLASGEYIHAWVVLHSGQDDGETVYKIIIPVKKRAKPSEDAYTEQERTEISRALAILSALDTEVKSGSNNPVTSGAVYEAFQRIDLSGEGSSYSASDLLEISNIKNKVDKEEGKSLSTNDFTDEEKEKLSNIEEGAQKNVNPEWDGIVDKPELYTKEEVDAKLSNKADNTSLATLTESVGVALDTKANADSVGTALSSKVDKIEGKGLSTEDYTPEEKAKLKDIEAGAQKNNIPDWSDINNKPELYTKSEIDTKLTGKVDAVTGKVLSSNDFTDELKSKVESIDQLTSGGVDISAEDYDALSEEEKNNGTIYFVADED